MAHRHKYNTPPVFEAEPEQHWNRVHTEDQYLHFARTTAAENSPVFHPAENGSVEGAHYTSQWNIPPRLNGYSSSSQLVTLHHYQPDPSEASRDSLHALAAPNVFMVPENHAHNTSSSNFGVESSFDLSMGNGRGPYKRKSPGIPAIGERGSSSRFYCPGSSSDVSSSSELRQEKSTLDFHHSHWELANGPPSYRSSHLSIGGESSARNVRSRSAIDLESEVFRTHLPADYPHHPSSSRVPIDHSGMVDHTNQNPCVPLQEWAPIHVSSAPHGRIVPNNLNQGGSHFFGGSSMATAPGEMPGYHHEHISSRSSAVPPTVHPAPSHTRGVRSSSSHRSTPNSRLSVGSMRMGHMIPSDEGMQLLGESLSSRHHPRPFSHSGWRNGDRSGRLRLSSERYPLFSEVPNAHDRLTPEGLMIVDRSLYGSRNMLDQHREMRLDVDNMSYEELLALGERIGSVSTGVCEDQLPKCLTETVYCSSDQLQEEGRCVICLEEYQHLDDVGTLKTCGHDYHVSCIKKWLSMKNICPICKGPTMPDNKGK